MDTLKATLDNVVLTSTFKVRHSGDAETVHEVKVKYNFDGVPVQKALEPALKKLNIKVQGILRDSFPTEESMSKGIKPEYEYSVAELLKPADRTVDPEAQASRALQRMTPEQLKAWKKQAEELGLI